MNVEHILLKQTRDEKTNSGKYILYNKYEENMINATLIKTKEEIHSDLTKSTILTRTSLQQNCGIFRINIPL